MKVITIINTCIAFCVFVLIWTFLSFTVLPHMRFDIGLPALEPTEVWSVVYAVLSKIAEYTCIVIILGFLFLYIIYKIMNALPDIILDMIGWTFTPFKELRQAGIFPLFDSLFGAIFSTKSMKDRIKTVAEGITGVVIKGSKFIVNNMADLGIPPNPKKYPPPPLEPVPSRPEKPTPIKPSINTILNEKYNGCLQEKIINITNGMSASDIQAANLQNQYTLIKCKLDQFKSSMELMARRA